MRRGGAALAAVLVGCGAEYPSDTDYAAARAEAECARLERCSLGFFESEYGDRDDCLSELTDDYDDLNDQYDQIDCTYDGAEAGACVSRVRSMSCDDWYDGDSGRACDLVWSCDYQGYYR